MIREFYLCEIAPDAVSRDVTKVLATFSFVRFVAPVKGKIVVAIREGGWIPASEIPKYLLAVKGVVTVGERHKANDYAEQCLKESEHITAELKNFYNGLYRDQWDDTENPDDPQQLSTWVAQVDAWVSLKPYTE